MRLKLDGAGAAGRQADHPATRQRKLETAFAQLVHQMSIGDAEVFLEHVVAQARRRVEDAPGS